MAEKNYWQWFCSSLFYAPGLEHKLLEKYGTPERVFHSKEQELTESFPSNQEKLTILAVNRKKWDFNREAERLQRLNLTFLSIEDPAIPSGSAQFRTRPAVSLSGESFLRKKNLQSPLWEPGTVPRMAAICPSGSVGSWRQLGYRF